MQTKYPLNLFGPIFAILLWGLAIFLILEISSPFFLFFISGKTLPRTWILVLVLDILFLIGPLIPTWGLIREYFTVLNSSEIRRPKIFGYKVIKWNEILSVEETGFSLIVKSKSGWMVFSLGLYKNPQMIVDFIRKKANL
jgi:hypothetical protein